VKQLGSVGIVPPREIIVNVWDANAVASVAKALEGASLGLSVQTEGNVVRAHLPELSAERRQEFIKYAGQITEQTRIKVRRERDEWNKKIQKFSDGGELSEDQKFKQKEEVQKATEEIGKEIEKMASAKIAEINS
jgi:ribosome recycling factor